MAIEAIHVNGNFGYSPLKLYEYMVCGKPVIASKI